MVLCVFCHTFLQLFCIYCAFYHISRHISTVLSGGFVPYFHFRHNVCLLSITVTIQLSPVWHLYFLSTKKGQHRIFAPMMSFFLCPDCPAHFGGTRPSVCSALLRRRTDDVLRIVAVNPTLISLFERLLHKLVLSRVEGENCHAPARS